jgi:hypothetical protein
MSYYLRAVRVADREIRKFGARCALRRDGVDRECWACIVDYSPRERTEMIEATDRAAIISVVGLEIPPDKEAGDQLVTFLEDGSEDEVLNIVAAAGKLQQARTIVYWELQVRPE